jgi:hypothetical protein
MKFNYKRYPNPHGIAISRPVIPIVLQNPRAYHLPAIGYEALVDSGSDRSIFPSEIAELLGIDLMATDRVFNVAGVVAGERRPIYVHPVQINVGGTDGPSFVTNVGFMPDLSDSGHGLLGRNGFFDQFSFVKFRDVENDLEMGKRHRR